jgi:hypothetical protein
MRVNDLQRVTVRVADESSTASTTPDLPGTGPVTTEPVPVGSDVKATLTGPDFKIARVGDDDGRRVLVTGGYVDWAWDVRPQRSGPLQLEITLYVLLEDGTTPIEVRTYDRSVQVDVNAWFGFKSWLKEWGAITGISVPVIVGGIWAFFIYRRQHAARSAGAAQSSLSPKPRPRGRRKRASRKLDDR